MSIKKIIRRLFYHRQYVNPIVDENVYQNLEHSYAGGSLAESNILIVANMHISQDIVSMIEKNENASVSILYVDYLLSVEEIEKVSGKLIGPYTHIINIYRKDEETSLLTQTGEYLSEDDMYRVYQWLQEEVSYLVPLDQYATICTAYISDGTEYSKVLEHNMEMIALSLGDVMGNHSIINNGIVAQKSVTLENIINTALFMSSKYGQILGGAIHLR